MPDAVYRRVKKPFLAPPAMATPGTPLNELAQDTLRATTLPFVERTAVVRLLDRLSASAPDELPAIEALLMVLVSLTFLEGAYCSDELAPTRSASAMTLASGHAVSHQETPIGR